MQNKINAFEVWEITIYNEIHEHYVPVLNIPCRKSCIQTPEVLLVLNSATMAFAPLDESKQAI